MRAHITGLQDAMQVAAADVLDDVLRNGALAHLVQRRGGPTALFGWLARQRQQLQPLCLGDAPRPARARRLLQSLQPEARQAFAPQRHRRSRQAQRRGDRRCRMPLVDHQREFGSPHITLGRRAATDQRLERLSLLLRQLDDGRLPASTHEWQAYLQRSGM